jgi:N-acetylneuraminate synthase
MIIERQLDDLVIDSSAPIVDALVKITRNKSRFIVCVSALGHVEGVLTDGDFRRWVANRPDVDLGEPVGSICNRNVVTASASTPPAVLREQINDHIQFIPLLDPVGRIVAIARTDLPSGFKIGSRHINDKSACFVIAEIGINHNGSIETAKRLIDCAVSAGADCAKFQMRDMPSLYQDGGDPSNASADLGAQYTLDVLSRAQLTPDEMNEAFEYCRECGIIPLCTPWDLRTVALLAAYDMPAYKIASADLTNHDLLRAVAAVGKPVILSSGMSTQAEILESVNVLRSAGAQFALLHCNSTYPVPFKDIHLRYIERLRRLTGAICGYSGHERGYAVAIAAVTLGAKIIEKHITLDRSMLGNDHKVSLEPAEFAAMVKGIRQVEEALGSSEPRVMSAGERMNREVLAKSLVAACDIREGTEIQPAMVAVKSPGKGLQPNKRDQLIGKLAKRNFNAGDFFYVSDLVSAQTSPRAYRFKRPWGIPVRFHDWRTLYRNLPVHFLEFHLSYKDLEADLSKFFDEVLPVGLIVHSPDLFAGDHILNLAADDEEYRTVSIKHLQRAIDTACKLRRWFPIAQKIPVIASLGGMSRDEPLPIDRRAELYERIRDGLTRLKLDGAEIMPQTLPPFPWYIGGQLFCNLFVDPEDTAVFCKSAGLKLCFDTAHSKLAANQRKRPFGQFIDILAPIAGHLHIVDATGVDGEGVQIGEGEIDFQELAVKLNEYCPDTPFIPEIWQGHKNNGEGFWTALERLEGLL